ncbi:ABC transporter permease [Fodinisporobacter ferrooxydans]|uniref:ABC transporter permease n=1 Tax=Fodinisporobacter ferrooxydans TaxID=2901836 RepID=A0ABY4CJG0_9BACL|nr:ABC transporter permease [Alicyclobacillaceae bacterium MYW30-H2]
MYSYMIRRVLTMIPTVLILSILLFAISHLAKGDPLAGLVNPSTAKNPDYIQHLRHVYGLDRPAYVQYFLWLKNMLHGDFGYSMSKGLPVSMLLKQTIGNSLKLAIAAEMITLAIGIPAGILAARNKDTYVDYTATAFTLVSLSTPSFFIGLILIYVFAITLQWLPAFGTSDPSGNGGALDSLRHMILPALTIAVIQIAPYIQYMRSSMLDHMRMDYVRTARAKGLREREVMNRHVLRNAMIPIITLFGLDITTFLAGAPITEYVFTWPGIGQLSIHAVLNRDYTVIMAVNVIAAAAVLIGNLISDMLYALADPRIRYD